MTNSLKKKMFLEKDFINCGIVYGSVNSYRMFHVMQPVDLTINVYVVNFMNICLLV